MLLASLLAATVAFTIAVAWLVMQPPVEDAPDPARVEPVRRLIEQVRRESEPSFDPGQLELDLR